MKILLLSSLYPNETFSSNTTNVVHDFTKEWVKMGIDVRVIHNLNIYPRIITLIPSIIKKFVEAHFGIRLPIKSDYKKSSFTLDGVRIVRLPILKIIPYGNFSTRKINAQTRKIQAICADERFHPTHIIGHWENPQIPIINHLKEVFRANTVIVIHNLTYVGKNRRYSLNSFNNIGFRSATLRTQFEQRFGQLNNSFLCLSGLPDKLIAQSNLNSNIQLPIRSYLFVGLLIKRKFPEIIIDALIMRSSHANWTLTYLGEGMLSVAIKKRIKKHAIYDRVFLKGQVPRNQVIDCMIKSDCFIMISKDEAFGLVYLEAMLSGCITIAAKGEGMDGIINHGINGFLCKAGNVFELSLILETINSMSANEIRALLKNAYETASNLSQGSVAKNYLDQISEN